MLRLLVFTITFHVKPGIAGMLIIVEIRKRARHLYIVMLSGMNQTKVYTFY